MRLSWPRDDDKKRAITMDLPPVVMRARPTNLFFINTTWRDVELHNDILPHMEPLPEAEAFPNLWRYHQVRTSDTDLIHYCKLKTGLCRIQYIIHIAYH